MPRRGSNIYRRKDGRWEARFEKGRREDGRLRYGSVYARSYREAKEKKERARREWERCHGKDVSRGGILTLSCAAEGWLSEKAATVKPSTICKYRNLLSCYILPVLGDKEVSHISTADVSGLIRELTGHGGRSGMGLSASTLGAVVRILGALKAYVLRMGGRASYSTDGMRIRREKKPLRVLSSSEQSRLLGYLLGHTDEVAVGILICMFTGLRIGEICALKWSDIDLEGRVIYVSRTMQRIQVQGHGKKTMVHTGRTKTGSSMRCIPIMESLIPMLGRYYTEDAYVLTGRADKFMEPRSLLNRYKRLLSECGMEDAGFHAIRHGFATRCVETGFDIKSLSRILGHSSVSITMDLYVHPSEEHIRKNMERLAALFLAASPSHEPSYMPSGCRQGADGDVSAADCHNPRNPSCATEDILTEKAGKSKPLFEWEGTDDGGCRMWCHAGGRRYLFADCILTGGGGYKGWIYDVDLDAFRASDHPLDGGDMEYIESFGDDYGRAYAIADCIDHTREVGTFGTEDEMWEGVMSIRSPEDI